MSKGIPILLSMVVALYVPVFLNVHDRPIIENLHQYYQITHYGKLDTVICGEKATLFWGDFTEKEKQDLQLMLRTP